VALLRVFVGALALYLVLIAHLGKDRRRAKSAQGKAHVSAVNQKNHGNRYKRGKDGKKVLAHRGGSGKGKGRASPASKKRGEPAKPATRKPTISKPTVEDDDPFADDPFGEDYGSEPESAEDEKQRKYEDKLMRDMEKAERSRLYETLLDAGGLQTRDDLREEYSQIPNTYKRKDGLPGDEMAEYLDYYHPEFGIRDERDLIDYLAS
jgi:hypothetical protein